MEHTWLRSAPEMLLRAASTIQDDDLLPLRTPASTFLFLHRLTKQCDDSTKPLGRFLALIQPSKLVEEIVRGLLPCKFNELRSELNRLQREKEDAVARQEWERARGLRDETDSLKNQLRRNCEQETIEVRPDHILQAISRLGFGQPITL